MPSEPDAVVVPLHKEEISVTKQQFETGRLRISIVTQQEEVTVDELLTQESIQVERTPVNKWVDQIPAVREEGDALIVPVVEEVLVVERRLILKEEVRVRRVQEKRRHSERVKIRKQEATITRLPNEAEATAVGSSKQQPLK